MPVIMVQKAVKNGAPEELEVMVDNRCSLENVTRFANNQGYTVQRDYLGCRVKIAFENPCGVSKGVKSVTVDGVAYEGNVIPREAFAGKTTVDVKVVLG